MKYIITGVDGQLGGMIAENVLKEVSGNDLIFTCPALSRLAPEKKEHWESLGVTIRQANYDNPKELEEAFQGGDRILILSGLLITKRVQQHVNAIDAAKAAGVSHITYTSFLGADNPAHSFIYVVPDHTQTEEYLRNCGVKYNIMRNNLYLENYLISYVNQALTIGDGHFYAATGEDKATLIHKADSARVAAALLLGKGEENTAYNICGSQAITIREICDMTSKLLNVDFEYTPLSEEEYDKLLEAAFIPRTVDGDFSKAPTYFCREDIVSNDVSIAMGLMNVESDAVELLTGQKAKTAADIVEDCSKHWKKFDTFGINPKF